MSRLTSLSLADRKTLIIRVELDKAPKAGLVDIDKNEIIEAIKNGWPR